MMMLLLLLMVLLVLVTIVIVSVADSGHDSVMDAAVALELALKKVSVLYKTGLDSHRLLWITRFLWRLCQALHGHALGMPGPWEANDLLPREPLLEHMIKLSRESPTEEKRSGFKKVFADNSER